VLPALAFLRRSALLRRAPWKSVAIIPSSRAGPGGTNVPFERLLEALDGPREAPEKALERGE
jgi:hypothetical protein